MAGIKTNAIVGTAAKSYYGVGGPGGGTPPLSPQSDALLAGTVTDITSLNEKVALDAANAKAATASATGYGKEIDAYGNVKAITANEALIAQVSGDITSIQQQQELMRTIGTQKATTATAGFTNSGSSLDILRSNLQQGGLQRQLLATQTGLNVAGYLSQGLAADAEIAGAKAAQDSATALAEGYTNAGTIATANAANETASLQDFLKNTLLTPAEKLTLSPLTGNPNSPTPPVTTDANGNLQPVASIFGKGDLPAAGTTTATGGGPPKNLFPEAYDSAGNLMPGWSSTYTGIGSSGYGTKSIAPKGF